MTTASIVFLPLGMAVARSLGYDEKTGIAMVMLDTNAGFAVGIYNPLSVGIAQAIAQLPLYSGGWLSWLLLAVLVTATSAYIPQGRKVCRTFWRTSRSLPHGRARCWSCCWHRWCWWSGASRALFLDDLRRNTQ